jgi:hypothetical protein
MSMRHPRPRRLIGAVVSVLVVAAVALGLVPATLEGGAQHGLQASVVASTRGPLCSNSCDAGSSVWEFIYVSNGNPIISASDGQFASRESLHNAFVVTSVEQRIFVDGDEYSDATFTPPPSETPRSWAGHWPSTLKCTPAPDTSPCTIIGSPAVVPGEQAAVLFAGWGHSPGEPNGKYVFRYTVHGTLNGEPVDVSASSKPIVMTD